MRSKKGITAEGLIPIAEKDTVASTIKICTDDLMSLGVKAGIYFLTPAFHSQVSKRTAVVHFGFPDNFIKGYLDPAIFENDPIPDYVMNAARTMSWEQVISLVKLPKPQIELTKTMVKSGIIDGICIPLFGPNARNSFTALLVSDKSQLNDQIFINKAINIAQFAHRKICLLVNRDRLHKTILSNRESEVIYWIAHGKSNQDIATILGISAGTVDTYVRRLYAKLDVNDRISAVVEGMSRGLVHI
jgi:DNA-binding CsgD family transcriptional regulator